MKILFLNFYIAGLQHAGKHLADMVRKLRNPTANPGFVVKSTWERLRRNPQNPKLTLQLNNFLHPSVKVNVMQIEKKCHKPLELLFRSRRNCWRNVSCNFKWL